MSTFIVDAEWYSDGDIVLDVQKIHCVVFKLLGRDCWNEFSDLNDTWGELKYFLDPDNHEKPPTFIGHNILGADMEVFRRKLGIDYTVGPDTIQGKPCNFIDTLSWSRRLWPDRPSVQYQGKSYKGHGLETWGVRNKCFKPEVNDWKNLPIEEYINRCKEDCRNNELTYFKLLEEQKIGL